MSEGRRNKSYGTRLSVAHPAWIWGRGVTGLLTAFLSFSLYWLVSFSYYVRCRLLSYYHALGQIHDLYFKAEPNGNELNRVVQSPITA